MVAQAVALWHSPSVLNRPGAANSGPSLMPAFVNLVMSVSAAVTPGTVIP